MSRVFHLTKEKINKYYRIALEKYRLEAIHKGEELLARMRVAAFSSDGPRDEEEALRLREKLINTLLKLAGTSLEELDDLQTQIQNRTHRRGEEKS